MSVFNMIGIFPTIDAQILEPECINPDGKRELDLRFDTGVQEFNELTKESVLTLDWRLKDGFGISKPFDVVSRVHPGSGASIYNVTAAHEGADYSITVRDTEHHINPLHVVPEHLWPFESYSIPAFLEINDDVKLCGWDFEGHKFGFFAENPNWKVTLIASESSFEEMSKILEGGRPRFENNTIVKFDTQISHSDEYISKYFLYGIIPFFPMLLIFAHFKYLRHERPILQITYFTGVSVLILTGLIAVGSTIVSLTLLEIITLSSIPVYIVSFVITLRKVVKKKNFEKAHF
ncbi:hypothetical protein [Nitrosopumilus sp.]|uniref:hypothetical protein n=1 Tax=Nitrosopumilus sp. TaxID=2024843 RepID=UPI00247CD4C6|nr:hypothetical protein [Nitrosopumilus sp.]MCV0430470.1 hypothetical protein [Nitrosopumilus sp.]